MKTLIEIYLLQKCARGRKITHLDSMIALAIVECEFNAPEWLKAIANLEIDAELPEAWALFLADLRAEVEEGLERCVARFERWLDRLDARIGEWLR